VTPTGESSLRGMLAIGRGVSLRPPHGEATLADVHLLVDRLAAGSRHAPRR
jgi:hypothetical protein